MIIAAFFFFMIVPIFLLIWYGHILLGHTFSILVIIAILVFGYVARKEGYVKQVSPKVRRLQFVLSFGLLTGFATVAIWRVLLGRPLPSLHSFLLFLTLTVVGACVGDKVGRKLKIY